jgi:hypothetical protein
MADDTPMSVNPDLDHLHDLLIAASEQLRRSLDHITDPDLADGVVTEMREILHRIDLVQSLLFTAASNHVASAVQKVDAANADLTASLETIGSLTTLVNTVTKFLTLVDTAIDLAKVV